MSWHSWPRHGFEAAKVLVMIGAIGLLPSVAAHATFIDAESWAALARGADLIKGDSDHACARFVRVPCANVDLACTDEDPLYSLDMEAKQPGSSGRACWPWVFAAGHSRVRT